jgi:hypothetical protein
MCLIIFVRPGAGLLLNLVFSEDRVEEKYSHYYPILVGSIAQKIGRLILFPNGGTVSSFYYSSQALTCLSQHQKFINTSSATVQLHI